MQSILLLKEKKNSFIPKIITEASTDPGFSLVVLQLLEMLSEEYGGRVELAKAYYKALTASVRKHFKGNGVIASMEHCNDFMLLGTEAIALGRVGTFF